MNTSIVETDLHPSCGRPWNNIQDNVLKNTIIHVLREVSIIPMKEDEREGTVIQVLSDIRQLSTYAHTTHLIQTQLQAGYYML